MPDIEPSQILGAVVIVDERSGRALAERNRLDYHGTIWVLERLCMLELRTSARLRQNLVRQGGTGEVSAQALYHDRRRGSGGTAGEAGGGQGRNGEAKGRDAKVGCVFTRTGLDEQKRPVCDEASTTYMGPSKGRSRLDGGICTEAVRRGC